jgi:hypothetical protein
MWYTFYTIYVIFDMWYMIYVMWYLIYDLWCMIYDMWCMIYDMWCMIYDICLGYVICDMTYDSLYKICKLHITYLSSGEVCEHVPALCEM